jgi:osmotically-inducible protein OsmY
MAMLTRKPVSVKAAKPTRTSQPGIQQLAERLLWGNPYLALDVSCECRYGVLILQGSVPNRYLKQVAHEVGSRLEGVEAVDNQIQIVPLPSRSGWSSGGKRSSDGAMPQLK